MRISIAVASSVLLTAAGAPGFDAQQDPALQTARLRAALQSSRPALAIGELDGDSTLVFGRIGHLVADSATGIFVLEALGNSIRWFDMQGRYRGTAGRTGSGPGEFRGPIRMAIDAQHRVHVLDVRGKIGIFAAGAQRLTHVKDVRTEVNGDRFCFVNDNYFLLSPYTTQVVRRLSAEGKLIASFGRQVNTLDGSAPPPVESAGTFLGRQNMAIMFCPAGRQLVVLVHESAPVIRAFRTSGELLWETRLRDYRQAREVPVAGRPGWRTVVGDPRTGTYTTANGVIPIGQERIAISMTEGPFLRGPQFHHEVRVFSVQDGREIERFSTSGAFVTSAANLLFAQAQEPFPRILAFALP